MNPFQGTANYYRRYRPPFPPEAAKWLHEQSLLRTSGKRLLDVGCGTGQVMVACAPYFEQMIGIDPDSGMLEEASDALKSVLAERRLIRLFQSRIEDYFPPEIWKASLVTFSRSFHWVEQDATLLRLADMTEPQGMVALMSDRSIGRGSTEWQRSVEQLVTEFLGAEGHPQMKPSREWGDVLAASPFSVVERAEFPVRRIWSYETILGYIYSTSRASKPHYGERAAEFEERLKAQLTNHSSNDQYLETDQWEVILGSKR